MLSAPVIAEYSASPMPGWNSAFTSSGHQASMMRIASESAYFLLPAEVSLRLAPSVSQVRSSVTACACAGSLGVPITWSSSGSTVSPRRSVTAASSMARVSEARVTFCPPVIRFLIRVFSRLLR